jgi:hypothetical protein
LDGVELAGSCQTGLIGHCPTSVGDTTLSLVWAGIQRGTLETCFLYVLAVRVMGYVRPASVLLDSGLRRNDSYMNHLKDLCIPCLEPGVGQRRISRGKSGCAILYGVICKGGYQGRFKSELVVRCWRPAYHALWSPLTAQSTLNDKHHPFSPFSGLRLCSPWL